jgi:hypothetical protein
VKKLAEYEEVVSAKEDAMKAAVKENARERHA